MAVLHSNPQSEAHTAPAGARFVVTILYREPTWEARFGRRARPCGGAFEVDAPDALTALATALVEFKQLEASSFTGWIRDIESVSVQHLASSEAA